MQVGVRKGEQEKRYCDLARDFHYFPLALPFIRRGLDRITLQNCVINSQIILKDPWECPGIPLKLTDLQPNLQIHLPVIVDSKESVTNGSAGAPAFLAQ